VGSGTGGVGMLTVLFVGLVLWLGKKLFDDSDWGGK
jgi:hypothetical protein